MNGYEKEALNIIEEVMEKADKKISDKLDDLFSEGNSDIDTENEILSLKAFYHKFISDQLINQGITPTDIPLTYLTSGNTGLPVPEVDFGNLK